MFGGLIKKLGPIKLWPYQVFLLILISFIFGISVAGYFMPSCNYWPVYLLMTLLLIFSAFINLILSNSWLVVISWMAIFIILGISAYSFQLSRRFCTIDNFSDPQVVSGEIVSNPMFDSGKQQFIFKTSIAGCNNHPNILIHAPRFPKYQIGQKLDVTGAISKPGMINDFDYARYLRPKYVSFVMLSPSNITNDGTSSSLKYKSLSLLYGAKEAFESSIGKTMPEPEASLAIGIITGSKGNFPQSLNDNLSISGLTHIVALSGYNVTIIIIAIAGLLAGRLSRWQNFLLGSAIVIVFIVMTGASASVVRAGIFSLLILFGRTLGRRAYQTNILFFTAAVMLAFNPFLLADDTGFQLSFLAFAGLLYLATPVNFLIEKSKFKKAPNYIKDPLKETLSAQIAVFPLISFAFGRISLVAPLSNLLVLWILPASMLISFCAGIAGIILYPLGKIISFAAWSPLAYVVGIAKLTSALPLASLNAGKYNLVLIILLYALIALSVGAINRRIKKWQEQFQN